MSQAYLQKQVPLILETLVDQINEKELATWERNLTEEIRITATDLQMSDGTSFANQDFSIDLQDDSLKISGTNLSTQFQFNIERKHVTLELRNFGLTIEAKALPIDG